MGEAKKSIYTLSEAVVRKKGVLKNFTKFTEKHLCQTFF